MPATRLTDTAASRNARIAPPESSFHFFDIDGEEQERNGDGHRDAGDRIEKTRRRLRQDADVPEQESYDVAYDQGAPLCHKGDALLEVQKHDREHYNKKNQKYVRHMNILSAA